MTSHLHDIGMALDFVPDVPYRVQVGSRPIVVVRVGDDFYALRDCRPHQGAMLSTGYIAGTTLDSGVGAIRYGRVGEILRCPWHGWEYDVKTGRSLFDPEHVRIRRYPVQVEDGRVIVDLS